MINIPEESYTNDTSSLTDPDTQSSRRVNTGSYSSVF